MSLENELKRVADALEAMTPTVVEGENDNVVQATTANEAPELDREAIVKELTALGVKVSAKQGTKNLKTKLDKIKAESTQAKPALTNVPPLAAAMGQAQNDTNEVTKEEAQNALKKFAAIHGAELAVSILNKLGGAKNISSLDNAGRFTLLKDLAAVEKAKTAKKEEGDIFA